MKDLAPPISIRGCSFWSGGILLEVRSATRSSILSDIEHRLLKLVSQPFFGGVGEISRDADRFSDMNDATGEWEGDLEPIPAAEGDFVRDGETNGDDGMSGDLSRGENPILH